ncbi:putative gamma-tubulin complex component protein [Arabidopsis thaliana]
MSESLLRIDHAGLDTLIPGMMCSHRVWTHSELAPPSVSVNESHLVKGLLQALQGFSSPFIFWDRKEQTFRAKSEIRVSHLSQSSLHVLLAGFLYAATCLKLVESIVSGINASLKSPPTLMAFSNSASGWLEASNIALNEEVKINDSNVAVTPTLLGLTSSLSSLSSDAEYLFQVVRGAIPHAYFESSSAISTAEIAVHVLDYLYKRLDEVCLVQGGELVAVEGFHMLLQIFAGSLLPYVESLDSWLFEGTLDDPFEELFFTANQSVSVSDAEFWEKSYLLTRVLGPKSNVTSLNQKKGMSGNDSNSVSDKDKEQNNRVLCPLFIKDICKSIVSAGKSLQLMQHIPSTSSENCEKIQYHGRNGFGNSGCGILLAGKNSFRSTADLSLSEIFCLSLAGLIGHGDHVSRYLWKDETDEWEISPTLASYISGKLVNGTGDLLTYSERMWYKLLVGAVQEKKSIEAKSELQSPCCVTCVKEEKNVLAAEKVLQGLFCHENLVVSASKMDLERNKNACHVLNLSENYCLPSLNDKSLLSAVFEGSGVAPKFVGTNYKYGFQFGRSEYLSSQDDTKILETLFPFPTLLPSFQSKLHMSEFLPYQKNSTLPSRVLSWILRTEPRNTLLPVVIMQECFTINIRRQVDNISKVIFSKLMNEWKLMHELAVLRAIYLLGSGDLLQHFLTVIFDRLGKGESSNDDFELNIIIQESIRNSADTMLLSSPDALVVSISSEGCLDRDKDDKGDVKSLSSPRESSVNNYAIDCLESLKFTYKVPWPLELIANSEAIKKYNQVMGFLLKVKRAKYVLDKARRLMWKGKGSATKIRKHHCLLEQKLLNFVDAFHQYVMDRVYHTAWRELCEAMVKAGSLDEVIDVHETYLLSIQRQCFVVQEKLWAIIASRINMILGLALEFYSIQQTLSSGGAVSAIKARWEMEIDRIEKQFEDCIAFLRRVLTSKMNVGHFPHLADLVTRINYNYHYMSDTGSSMTASGS